MAKKDKNQMSLFSSANTERGDDGALFSTDRGGPDGLGSHRYVLWRRITDEKERRGVCTFVMLNPSTADTSKNDPTIRSCIRLARDWGFGTLMVVNLFSWRSSDPVDLRSAPAPAGDPENMGHILDAARSSDMLVFAWGSSIRKLGALAQRATEVVNQIKLQMPAVELYCLHRNQTGEPTHPLFWRRQGPPMHYVPIPGVTSGKIWHEDTGSIRPARGDK